MTRPRILSTLLAAAALTILILITIACMDSVPTSAQQPKDTAKTSPSDLESLTGQVKELQKQVAELQTRVNEMHGTRIVASGTATFKLGAVQDNATNVRVQLKAEIAAKLGDDYIVLLTNRFPTGGYPFFAPYWKKAKDGFDITLVDVTLGSDSTATYAFNKNKTYPVDWIVVKK